VAVLESVGTAAAKALLADRAAGTADDPLTREAKAAVLRGAVLERGP
jgi:hypothetical protein